MKKIIVIILILITVGGVVGVWKFKPWLEHYLVTILEEKGLQHVDIQIAHIGLGGAALKKISIGGEHPFLLEDVTLNYTLEDLTQKRLDEILIENLSIKAVEQESGWQIYGLEGFKSDGSNQNPLTFLSLNAEQVEQIPFRRLAIDKSLVELQGVFGTLSIPLSAQWEKHQTPNLKYVGDHILFVRDDVQVDINNTEMDITLHDGVWGGVWNSAEVLVNNAALPSFTAQGALNADDKHLSATGDFISSDNVFKGDFVFDYTPENEPAMTFISNVNVDMPISGGQLKMPAKFEWSPIKPVQVSGNDGSLNWESGELLLDASDINMSLAQNDTGWAGDWRTDKISVTAPLPVPLLLGAGKINVLGSVISMSGVINSKDKTWKSTFDLKLGSAKKSANGLRLKSAVMPWKKGRLSVEDVWIAFEEKASIKITLKVEKVDLAELMGTLTGDRIVAKGIVSGYLRVNVDEKGNITVEKGDLGAVGPGTIIMPPETIPADNEQVNLVKDIMEDLRFELLNITAQPDENGNLAIKLSVEGKNPKVYDGHPVKLNINLTGNLLDFLEQNIMFLTKPETFLKGNQNYDKDK